MATQNEYEMYEMFVERIRNNVKVAEKICYNKNTGEITMWINGYFIVLDPQLDEGTLIYTTIKIEEWYYGKVINRFFISSDEIIYEHYSNAGYEKYIYKCDFGPNMEDPIYLIDEQELFNFLNNLGEEEFDFKEEFKSYSGLA